MVTTTTVARAVLLGGSTGIRSMTGPSFASWAATVGRFRLDDSWLEFLSYPDVAALFVFMAAGEIVADKLPFLPPRIAPLPFLFRMCAGAVVGAASFITAGASPAAGAAVGASSAAVGAVLTYQMRMSLDRRTGLPDPVFGLAEDVLALTMAFVAVSRMLDAGGRKLPH